MAHDVFISYASGDKPIADAICATLESHAIKCWIAPRDILPGQPFAQAILNAISLSKIFILVFSSKANISPYIIREVDRAVKNGIPIIPFRIEDVKPVHDLEFYLSTPHWLDALTPPLEAHILKLTKLVHYYLEEFEFAGSSGTIKHHPYAQFSAIPTSGKVPLEVTFRDESAGNPTKFLWEFGDGSTSSDQNPVHFFKTPGTYSVKLTIWNPDGMNTAEYQDFIVALPRIIPDARFSGDITSGKVPLEVTFRDESAGDPTQFLWEFGDGTTSSDQNPVHVYKKPGTFSVKLSISNPDGTNTTEYPDFISVLPIILPEARFSADIISGNEPLKVTFRDESAGNPTKFLWEFGDGSTSSDKNPVHLYKEPGTYSVRLSASNMDGTNTTEHLDFISVLPSIVPEARVSADVPSEKEPRQILVKRKPSARWLQYFIILFAVVGIVFFSLNFFNIPGLRSPVEEPPSGGSPLPSITDQNESRNDVFPATGNNSSLATTLPEQQEQQEVTIPVRLDEYGVALKWKFKTGSNNLVASPSLANGNVYIGSGNGDVFALDATSGAVQWKYPTGKAVYTSSTIADGMLYTGSSHEIYALDALSGAFIWKYKISGDIHSTPAVANGIVYFGGGGPGDTNVYALDSRLGTVIWKYPVGNDIDSSPAVANGVVYIGCKDTYLYALNATSGVLNWKYKTGGHVDSSPAVANGVVFFGSRDSNVYAMNAASGILNWKYRTEGPIVSSPEVVNGVVYIGSDDTYLYALDAIKGTLRWKYKNNVFVDSSPAVEDEVVYFGSYDTNVYALDARSGTFLWNYPTGNYIDSSPAVADGVVYIGSHDSYVYALDSCPLSGCRESQI
jgi:PKD repeat protein